MVKSTSIVTTGKSKTGVWSMRQTLLLSCVAAGLMATAPAEAAGYRPSALYIFGDSLVDAGNIFLATGGIYNPPSAGYFMGRFTNGPDYTDLLSQRLYGTLTTPSLAGGNNYAFGGARAVQPGGLVPDLTIQLGGYLAGHAVDPNGLYVLNFGGNDVFALNAGDYSGFPSASAYAATIIGTFVGAVQTLSALGAEHILVTGIPNISPAYPGLDAQLQTALDGAVLAPGTDLLRFSYLDFFRGLVANPAQYGVAPFTQPGNCFDHRTPDPITHSIDCSGYFSVDGVHPIAPIQAAIFREVAHITGVGAVPEPASWAMLIAGFGLTGAVLRRRRMLATA